MSDKKMVEIPWIDGTIREVEEGTPIRISDGRGADTIHYAFEAGFYPSPSCLTSPLEWQEGQGVVEVYVKTDDPPVRVVVPTKPLTVLKATEGPGGYILTQEGAWRGIHSGVAFPESLVAQQLRDGHVTCVFEGVED